MVIDALAMTRPRLNIQIGVEVGVEVEVRAFDVNNNKIHEICGVKRLIEHDDGQR